MAFNGGDPDHIPSLEDGPLDSAASFVALMDAWGPDPEDEVGLLRNYAHPLQVRPRIGRREII